MGTLPSHQGKKKLMTPRVSNGSWLERELLLHDDKVRTNPSFISSI